MPAPSTPVTQHSVYELSSAPPCGRYDSQMTFVPKQHVGSRGTIWKSATQLWLCSVLKCSQRWAGEAVTVKEENAKRRSDIYSGEAGAKGNQLLGRNGFLLLLLWPLKSAEAP